MDPKTRTAGSPLVILPGLLCDSRMFASQLRAFSGSQVIDGFYGEASTIATMARYALARAPERCALLGHSMGARVALEIWRQAPHRVDRLALADTGIHPPRPGEREQRYGLRDVGRERGIAALVDAWLPGMIGPKARSAEDLVSTLRGMCTAAGQEVFERQIEALLKRPPVEDLLPTIDRPVAAIVGSEDQWSPVAQHEAIVAAVPGAALHVIPSAGHMAPAEQPEAFNRAVSEWLSRPSNIRPNQERN